MKKNSLKVALASLCMCFGLDAGAQIFQYDGLSYDIMSKEDKTVSLTYGDSYYKGDIVIPATVQYLENEYKVLEVGYLAFENCWGVTSVTFPEGLKSIGINSFTNCTSLKEINIPTTVAEIRECAFEGCNELETVTFLGSGNISLMSNVFKGCKALNRVNTKDMESWFNMKFVNNESNPLTTAHNLYIDDLLVTDVVVPETIKKINDNAFNGCESLKSVTFSTAVDTIGQYAFQNCKGLEKLNTADVKVVGGYAFRDCTGIKDFTLNEKVDSIGDYAFTGCSGITILSFSDGLKYLGESAFSRCTNLVSVSTGNTLKEIKSYTFQECPELTTVNLGPALEKINYGAFSYNAALAEVTGGENLMDVYASAFTETLWLNSQPDGVVYLGSIAYKYKGSMPEGTDIVINDGTKIIGNDLFYMMNGLKSITFPESLVKVGDWAFYKCNSLTSVVLPDNVKHVGNYAFSYCEGLESISFGTGFEILGDGACSESANIKEVICMAEIPPFFDFSVWSTTEPFAEKVYEKANLAVPKSSVAAYEEHKIWGKFYYIEGAAPSAIEKVAESEFNVTAADGCIYVSGADVNKVEVFDINGQCVYIGTSKTISVAKNGVYVIRVGNNVRKVVL